MELHVKLFNAFAMGNYSRKIVDVYGIFFCDFYLCLVRNKWYVSREKYSMYNNFNRHMYIACSMSMAFYGEWLLARSNERVKIHECTFNSVQNSNCYSFWKRDRIFFLRKRGIYFLYDKYKIVPFEYKNYINFVRYSCLFQGF